MEVYMVAILFAHSLQGILAGPPVEVTPERIILLENRPLEVKCRVRQPIVYCRFDLPGYENGLSLRPGIPPHQGIQYLGAGFERGECGMLIQSVSAKHSGVINCSMGFSSEPIESKGNLTLIVAKPPDPPILQIYPGSSNYRDSFREGEVIQANCRIINARPVANISWFLGSEPIYDRLGPPVIEEENGLKSISQNMSRKVSYLDHGKDLKCVADHMALSQRNINHSIYKLNIRFPPKPKSQELEKFGFTIGQPGKIVVTFQANPIPDILWKVDQDDLKQGSRDRTGRFEAGVLQHKGAGTWNATLLIHTVRPEEVEKRYTLIAKNELGHESYKVAISTSPEPPADITAGTIVGIVIAVLIILLLVFILIFARATGRWCFAGGVPRPPGESLPSYRWCIGKRAETNPQKVNSLVYKDYTLVEHEDGTKSYVSPAEKTRLLLDEKLKASIVTQENETAAPSSRDITSDSDSEYEKPVVREKSKTLDDKLSSDLMRTSSLPFSNNEISPGDNGRINLPPYIVPLETSLTFPMTKQKTKKKKKNGEEEGNRFSFSEPFWAKSEKKTSDTDESPEDAEVRKITEKTLLSQSDNEEVKDKEEVEEPKEMFPEEKEAPQKVFPVKEAPRSHFRPFSLPLPPSEILTARERRLRNKKLDTNPLKKMFGIRGVKRAEVEEEPRLQAEEDGDNIRRRYTDAALSHIQSDTESADHGSADKSSVTKLTNEKQPKKLMSGLLGSFRKGKNKDKVADNDLTKNPPSFEITLKEQSEDVNQTDSVRAEGIVYAELDMARSPGNVMRRDDEKTEYAEIIYPGTKLTAERAVEELRKSRENLTSSRENLTNTDEAFSTTPEGMKEAAV